MPTKTTLSRNSGRVIQFSVFTPNRLGRLHDLISVLGSHGIHVLALAVMDTTDCAIIRLVVDDPDKARGLLLNEGFPFSESKLLVVEIHSTEELNRLMAAFLEAEINILSLFLHSAPAGTSPPGLSMEDNDLAEQVLQRHQIES
jgi:hypothetical protein